MMSETPTGRELDAMVATRIFGYMLGTPPNPEMALPPGKEYPVAVPRYSTDISAAWLVVEAPILATWLEHVEVSVIRYPDRYECHIENDTAATLCVMEADTAPLAICRAALALADHFSQ